MHAGILEVEGRFTDNDLWKVNLVPEPDIQRVLPLVRVCHPVRLVPSCLAAVWSEMSMHGWLRIRQDRNHSPLSLSLWSTILFTIASSLSVDPRTYFPTTSTSMLTVCPIYRSSARSRTSDGRVTHLFIRQSQDRLRMTNKHNSKTSLFIIHLRDRQTSSVDRDISLLDDVW